MRRKSPTLCSIFVVIVLLLTTSYAWSALAVATDNTSIFRLDSVTGTSSNFTVDWGTTLPTQLAGVVTVANQGLLYVVDKSAAGPLLHVLEINSNSATPTARRVGNPIELWQGDTYVSQPSSLSMDANGGFYVLGNTNYAYVTSGYNVSVNMVASSSEYRPLADIATFSGGAVIVHENNHVGLPAGESWSSTVSGANTTSSHAISDQDNPNYTPRAVAVHPDNTTSSLAYILSEYGESSATVTVVDAATSVSPLGLASSIFDLPENMIPLDITAFTTLTGKKCIGIVAKNDIGAPPSQVLWRYELGSDGRVTGNRLTYNLLGTYSQNHRLQVSADGEVLWIANVEAGTVDILDTDSWSLINQLAVSSHINYTADWDGSFITPPVPEPSSFIAFLTFATGMFGLARRRKR